ncbi:hypothetical protein GCM10009818_36110 [Nakamurella flavida]
MRRRWLTVHLATLIAAAGWLFWSNRKQYFFGDDWEFLVNRGLAHPTLNLFIPHNEHWSTVPLLVYAFMRNTVGLGTLWPFVIILIAVHLSLTHFLWRVFLRSGVPAPLATAAALLFALLGAGSENLLWTFQIGFIGSIACGWAAVLLVDHTDTRLSRRDGVAAGLLVVSLACSGIGVPAVALAGLVVLARSRSLLRPLVVGGVPTAVFVAWYFIGEKLPPAPGPSAWDSGPVALLKFIARGFLEAIEATTGLPRPVAGVLLVAAAGWAVVLTLRVVRRSADSERCIPALAGLLAGVAFYGLSGFGRATAMSSRYFYVCMAFVLPALILALWHLLRLLGRRVGPLVGVLLLVPVLVHNLVLLADTAEHDGVRETTLRSLILGTAELVGDGEPILSTTVEPLQNPDLTVAKLTELVAAGNLPADEATPEDLLRARLQGQVSETDGTPLPTPSAPMGLAPVADGQNLTVTAADPGCVTAVSDTADPIRLTAPGSRTDITVQSSADATLRYSITSDGRRSPQERDLVLTAGTPDLVTSVLPEGTTLAIMVPAAGLVVCGVR